MHYLMCTVHAQEGMIVTVQREPYSSNMHLLMKTCFPTVHLQTPSLCCNVMFQCLTVLCRKIRWIGFYGRSTLSYWQMGNV